MSGTLDTKYLIIGNSAGGIGAVESIRQVDRSGSITIVSDEPYPAYSRPLISKYLAGECKIEQISFRPIDFYRHNSIGTLLGRKATHIDAKKHNVKFDDGTTISWEKLLLATGGSPIVPQMEGGNSPAVFTFTTLDDAKAIDRYIKKGMRVIVIGGGLIGVSVTEALVKRGVKVTIIEMKDRILNTILDETASAMATAVLEKHEVKIITNRTVTEINSEFTTDRIHAVTLDDSRGISCEAVIIAIGVRPRSELATDAGIRTNRGIVVDRNMKTSKPDIYACGDVAEAYDFIYGENRVTPIWPSAYLGGKVAGFNMASVPTEYTGATSMNSLSYFGMAITSAGTVIPPDKSYEVISRQDQENYRKVVLKDGLLTGLIFYGNIEQSGIIFGLMKDKVNVSGFKQTLVADDFSFVSLPEPLWRERLSGSFKPQTESESITVGVLQ